MTIEEIQPIEFRPVGELKKFNEDYESCWKKIIATLAVPKHLLGDDHMSQVMTPERIKVLLHYYYTSKPIEDIMSDHVEMVLTELQNLRLIEDMTRLSDVANLGRFRVTERGRVYCEMILSLPLPEQTWVDPRIIVLPSKDT